jgi:hypothetical protein
MKKALFGLVFAILILPLFADDALVLPSHVIRTYFVGNYAMISKEYDSDGKKQDIDDVKVFNLGAAVEYGINDWISGALQWVPGYNVYSKLDADKNASLGDTADLFIGAKVQVVGPKAPVQNDTIRFAIAPGVKVPLSQPDYEEEAVNYAKGDGYLAQSADLHLFAFGTRTYLDYVVNESFFLNFYTQFLYYPGSKKAVDASLTDYSTVATVRGKTKDTSYDPSFKYGYDLTLELDPHYTAMLNEGLEFGASLPFTYTMNPAVEVSGDTYKSFATRDDLDSSYRLSVGPNVSLFFQKSFLPIELKTGYTIPLAGKNTNASNVLLLELKAYAKL